MKTFSLTEVADMVCGDSMARPERWLTAQIRSGRFTARRVGRHWRMTQTDIDHALAVMANTATATTVAAAAPEIGRPSAQSRRRRLAVAQ